MARYQVIYSPSGEIDHIETQLTGYELLGTPKLNKGCAFSQEERDLFHLQALLPQKIESLEEQAGRMLIQYQSQPTNLAKNIYLNVLHDYNETLFYKLISDHLEAMLPIIYTPTVGEAVERFSLEHRKPRGLYVSYPDRDRIAGQLDDRITKEIDLTVVSDGGAVLGLGDQGIGGMNICSAKLMVYTLCGGINPHRVLPIQLDVGTDNEHLLKDPMYLGWRHERISGQAYDDFIDHFVQVLRKKYPHVLLHWEDLGRDHARNILQRYQDKILTFNGDIQGTGVVTSAAILAAMQASGRHLAEHRIIIFGAGTAGMGIADQLVETLCRSGLSAAQARACFWLIDKNGLLHNQLIQLLPSQKPYARMHNELMQWQVKDIDHIKLEDVIEHIHPTILIGVSAVSGAFTEKAIRKMAAHTEHPIILPLSNPPTKMEAQPEDLIKWTEGKAIIATGSPFPAVQFKDRIIHIAQSNNAYAFPGIGLGAIAAKAKLITNEMLWAATQALSQCSPAHHDLSAPLLPSIATSRNISLNIAQAVAQEAFASGLSGWKNKQALMDEIEHIMWEPKYYEYRKK